MKSIWHKLKCAIDLAVNAGVGVEFTYFEALELRGYINALEETIATDRAFDRTCKTCKWSNGRECTHNGSCLNYDIWESENGN